MIARPCRRTCFARPETSVARNAPAAGAAYSRPEHDLLPLDPAELQRHRRQQRDREPEDHRVQVGQEHRLERALALQEAEPVLDRLPADLVLLVARRRRPHPRDLRDHDQERDRVEHERAGRLRSWPAGCPPRPARASSRACRTRPRARSPTAAAPGRAAARATCRERRPVERVQPGRDEREDVQRPQQRLVEERVHAPSASRQRPPAPRASTIASRRRSSASANAPPTIGKTNTGTSSASPSSPTASVDPVIS